MAIADLFSTVLVLCAVILLLVVALIGFCLWRFRAREAAEPPQTEGNRRLEIAWTAAPLIILAWLLFLTTNTMATADRGVDRAADITVIAHQWWWAVQSQSQGQFQGLRPFGHVLGTFTRTLQNFERASCSAM